VYSTRRRILDGEDISDEIKRLLMEQVEELTKYSLREDTKFVENYHAIFPLDEKVLKKIGSAKDKDRLKLALKETEKFYKERDEVLAPAVMRKLEREIYLQILDALWMQHLENMTHLRDGIHWRSVGQRDPLVEYRAESQRLFEQLQVTLREEVLRALSHVGKADIVPAKTEGFATELTKAAEHSVAQGVNEVDQTERHAEFAKKPTQAQAAKAKTSLRKKRKAQRQNRKKK
jgi:preprotein translocase subunit SecA